MAAAGITQEMPAAGNSGNTFTGPAPSTVNDVVGSSSSSSSAAPPSHNGNSFSMDLGSHVNGGGGFPMPPPAPATAAATTSSNGLLAAASSRSNNAFASSSGASSSATSSSSPSITAYDSMAQQLAAAAAAASAAAPGAAAPAAPPVILLRPDQGPTRKQNVACDGCRGRKVKCNRLTGAEQCEHCKAKGLECTFHYVTNISSSRSNKKDSSRSAAGGNADGSHSPPNAATAEADYDPTSSSSSLIHDATLAEQAQALAAAAALAEEGSSRAYQAGGGTSRRPSAPTVGRPSKRRKYASTVDPASSSAIAPLTPATSTTSSNLPALPSRDPSAQIRVLLAYLFWPYVVRDSDSSSEAARAGYRDWIAGPHELGWPKAPTFEGKPSEAHLKLLDEAARADLAADLIETYFQIVHIRFPLIDPDLFRKQFANPSGPHGPPLAALVATVLGWGAKYSEHPIVTADREECSRNLHNGRQRSRLVQVMTCRAQQILETDKLARLATMESVQTCYLMGVLQGESLSSPRSMCPIWFRVATTQAQFLGYNKRKVLQELRDPRSRFSAAFCWWIISWSDALISVIHRHTPALGNDDEDIEAIDGWRPNEGVVASSAGADEYLLWNRSMSAFTRICRFISNNFWKPRFEREGLPLKAIIGACDMLAAWRDEFLPLVGVPTVWPSDWDFVAAVGACTNDANYHLLCIIIAQTIREFGIAELRQIDRGTLTYGNTTELDNVRMQAEKMRDRVLQDALHGALRIAALTSVLATNSYLRLDPSILGPHIYEAGIYLGRLGREEAQQCIAGLRQYGMAYEEAYDRLEDIEAVVAEYASTARAASRPQQQQQQQQVGGGGTSAMVGLNGQAQAPGDEMMFMRNGW